MTLTLKSTAVGSLPYKTPEQALDLVFEKFPNFPFWPQLSHVNKMEDMIFQFTQNIPGLIYNNEENRFFFDMETEDFYEKLEEFFLDYEAIINDKDYDLLDKYGITGEFSSTINLYLDKLKETTPEYAKGQITGPFTWGTTLTDDQNKCAFYDDTLREIVIKGLTLKALWQVKIIKEASPNTIPVIFFDEPSMSQYGTSAFLTVTKDDITSAISEIATILKENGAKIGIHCCGKTDWSLIFDSNVDIINFDGFFYGESLALYAKDVENFIKKGGFIAWGVVPTLDVDALESSDIDSIISKFDEAKSYLLNKGLDEKLILKQSFFTPSCGAGSLNESLAQKAMTLTSQLGEKMIKKYAGELV